jgi:hypothetical protein
MEPGSIELYLFYNIYPPRPRSPWRRLPASRPCGLRARAIPRGAAARGRSRRGRRVSVTSLRRRARGRTEVSDPRRATAGRRRRSEICGRSGPRGPWRPPGRSTRRRISYAPAGGVGRALAAAPRESNRDRFPHVRTQFPASARARIDARVCIIYNSRNTL